MSEIRSIYRAVGERGEGNAAEGLIRTAVAVLWTVVERQRLPGIHLKFRTIRRRPDARKAIRGFSGICAPWRIDAK